MRILAFDQSLTRTGWCILTNPRSPAETMRLGWFSSPNTASFGVALGDVFSLAQPDFVAFETPRNQIMTYKKKPGLLPGDGAVTPNAKQLVLPWIAGQIEQACIDRAIPYELVSAATWRARVIGKGAGQLPRKQAKQAARTTCDRLGIDYPNEDCAEAALIALWAASCDTVRLMRHALQEARDAAGSR